MNENSVGTNLYFSTDVKYAEVKFVRLSLELLKFFSLLGSYIISEFLRILWNYKYKIASVRLVDSYCT